MDALPPESEPGFAIVSPQSLERVLDQLCQSGQSGPGCTVDCRATLERLEGDWELFADLLVFFFEDAFEMKDAVLLAIADEDPAGLCNSAHKFRGFISNFGAQRIESAALQLEQIGQAGHLRSAEPIARQLERELELVSDVLRQFRAPA